jgi:hypothetical protein
MVVEGRKDWICPRQPVLDAHGTVNHVMGQGIEIKKIFKNKANREDFVGQWQR